MPRISVIMSVYNQELYIKESIQSILAQTFKDFELILIDDGSKDNSLQIMESMNDKRIKIIPNQKNEGLIYSLNRGLDEAIDCEYIARMDSDDIALPDRLEQQSNFLDRHPKVGLLGGAMNFFSENGKEKIWYLPKEGNRIVSTFFCYNPFHHPAVMLRSKVLSGLKYDSRFPKYEDYAMWISLIGTCDFHNLKRVLVNYRRHSNNVTNTYKNNVEEDFNRFREILMLLQEKLAISLSNDELDLLSIVSRNSRASMNERYSLKELNACIKSVIAKVPATLLDKPYLKQLLVERCLFYLITTNRKTEIPNFLLLSNSVKDFPFILSSILSGRKWS